MFCPNCGNKTSDNAVFCGRCGFDLRTPDFSAAGQQPEPQPEPQPTPQPTPQPIPQPTPQQTPQPMPQQVYVQPMPQFAPPMPQPQKKKGSMGIVIILVALAVIVGVGIGFAVSYMNNNKQEAVSPVERATEPSLSALDKSEPNAEVSTDMIEIVHTSYKAVKSDDKWTDANSQAIKSGGELVSINSEEEFEEVCKLAEEEGIKVFWASAKRYSSDLWEDTLWSDGSDITFTHWLAGEPSYTSEEGEDEKYLMVFKVGDKWYFNDAQNDVSSYYSGKMGYIIEYTEYEQVVAGE